MDSVFEEKNKLSRDEYRELVRGKIVSVARAVLDGEVGIITGSRKLRRLGFELGDETEPDFITFIAVDSETDHLPIGRERENWSEEALRRKDIEVSESESLYRERVLKACERLVERFGATSGGRG